MLEVPAGFLSPAGGAYDGNGSGNGNGNGSGSGSGNGNGNGNSGGNGNVDGGDRDDGGGFMSPISVLTEATRPSVVVAPCPYPYPYPYPYPHPQGYQHQHQHQHQQLLPHQQSPLAPAGQAGTVASASSGMSRSTYRGGIPLDMLDLRYVAGCDCPERLGRIVAALEEDGCGGGGGGGAAPRYPSLLRVARNRLRAVREGQKGKEVGKEQEADRRGADRRVQPVGADRRVQQAGAARAPPSGLRRVNFAPAPAALALQDFPTGEEGMQEGEEPALTPRSELLGDTLLMGDSLVMDVSASVSHSLQHGAAAVGVTGLRWGEEEEEDEDDNDNDNDNDDKHETFEGRAAPAPAAREAKEEKEELRDGLANVLAEHSVLKSELDAVAEERDALGDRLARQTGRLRDLERRMEREREGFEADLGSLEREREAAAADAAALRGGGGDPAAASRARELEVAERLRLREREVLALEEELCLVREKRRKENEAMAELHDELLAEVEYLTNELNEQQTRSEAALRDLQVQLGRDFEDVVKEQRSKIDDLTYHLGFSRSEVDRLTEEQTQLSSALDHMRQNERQKETLANRLEKRKEYEKAVAAAASSRAAANAMAKALAESEKELASATERKEHFERKYVELMDANAFLVNENRGLSERIQTMTEELANSHGQVKSLSARLKKSKTAGDEELKATSKLNEELRAVERGYKAQIFNLMSQLEDKKTWVPVDKYRKAVKQARKNAAALHEKEDEVAKLASKLKRGNNNSSGKVRKRGSRSSSISEVKTNWKRVAEKSERKSRENRISAHSHQVSPTSSEESSDPKVVEIRSPIPIQVCIPTGMRGKSSAALKASKRIASTRNAEKPEFGEEDVPLNMNMKVQRPAICIPAGMRGKSLEALRASKSKRNGSTKGAQKREQGAENLPPEVNLQHPVSGKSLARQNALRAAGGKKGLADKLRRTRSGKTSPKVRVPMAEVQ
jgi:hypothetical protein